MKDLLDYWEKHWISWQKTPQKFNNYLQDLNKSLLGTKVPDEKLAFVDYAPLHLVGNWTKTEGKLFIGSLNPGAAEHKEFHRWESDKRGYDWVESRRQNITWEQQAEFCLNFFRNMSTLSFKHPFYIKVGKVINGVYSPVSKDWRQICIQLQKKLVSGELIPFYSKDFQLHRNADPFTLEEFWNRMKMFLINSHFNTFLLNGKGAYERFLKNKEIEHAKDEKPVTVQLPHGRSKVEIIRIKDFYGVLSPHIGRINSDDGLGLISSQLKRAMKRNGYL
ncbi:MAG: hypothetical protein ACFFC7_32740 [Candidatus Hermodarchaeota archaeon]